MAAGRRHSWSPGTTTGRYVMNVAGGWNLSRLLQISAHLGRTAGNQLPHLAPRRFHVGLAVRLFRVGIRSRADHGQQMVHHAAKLQLLEAIGDAAYRVDVVGS